MRNRKGGFTLVEIIVSLALICIIAIGIIPAFAAQLKLTIQTKEITAKTFDAQGEMERVMSDLIKALQTPATSDENSMGGVTPTTMAAFGVNRTVYRLEKDFPGNANKGFVVYLSPKLAQMEIKQLLTITGASIQIKNSTSSAIADLKLSPAPQLVGLCSAVADSNWYTNVYNWYVSKVGDTNPTFPEDYSRVIYPGNPSTLTDLSSFANRYVIFEAIPVDIHGVRGNGAQSNAVLVLGPEWRAANLAWVDRNENVTYDEDDAVLAKTDSLPWVLIRLLDTGASVFNPDKPTEPLNAKDGSLYVPMNVSPPALSTVGPVNAVSGEDVINWTVDKDINLATSINATNPSKPDIHLKTREGSIILYQYLKLSTTSRAAMYDAFGKPYLITSGASLNATYGDVTLNTEKRGNVIMQNYTAVNSGQDISMTPFGNMSIYQGTLKAKDSILLDTTQGKSYYGNNRDLIIQDSKISLAGTLDSGSITLKVPDGYDLIAGNTSFAGITTTQSALNITADKGIVLNTTNFDNLSVNLNSNASMKGGGWNSQSKVKVAEGTGLHVAASGGIGVKNEGSLILGDTGSISFETNMVTDLANAIHLILSATSDEDILIETDYGRNVDYADPVTGQGFLADGTTYQSLGSGSTNLEFKATKDYGSGSYTLSYDFDGTSKMKIHASGGSQSTYAFYTLTFADKYAEDVSGWIKFKVYKGEADPVPTVDILGSSIPTQTVTFKLNGGNISGSTGDILKVVNYGLTIGNSNMPADPNLYGYSFAGWNTAQNGTGTTITGSTSITGNLDVYAQWTVIPRYTVTFMSQSHVYTTRSALYNTALGAANMPPVPTRADGYGFAYWSVGAYVFDENTKIMGPTTVIDNWSKRTYFGSLANGTYIVLKDSGNTSVVFQKVDSDKILRVGVSSSDMGWTSANTDAIDYYKGFSNTPWVLSSGLLPVTTLSNLYNGGYAKSILASTNNSGWWAGVNNGDIYRVWTYDKATGNIGIDIRNNKYYSYRLRPYITLSNTESLYVYSGLGTEASPYVLVKQ